MWIQGWLGIIYLEFRLVFFQPSLLPLHLLFQNKIDNLVKLACQIKMLPVSESIVGPSDLFYFASNDVRTCMRCQLRCRW